MVMKKVNDKVSRPKTELPGYSVKVVAVSQLTAMEKFIFTNWAKKCPALKHLSIYWD